MPRRFQYSLKIIFVLILLAAAFFGGMAVQRRETQRALQLAEQERERAQVAERKAMDAMEAERAARAEAEAALARATSDDGQAMLNVRAVWQSSYWENFQTYRIKDEQAKLHPNRALITDYVPTALAA